MPDAQPLSPSAEEQALDRHLILSLMLSVSAAAVNTVVGFTVAHWIEAGGSRATGYLVTFAALALCAAAALLARRSQRGLTQQDDTLPAAGRRVFMARLALLVAAFATIVVLAGTLVLVTLLPNQ